MSSATFTHLLNPVSIEAGRDLFAAQTTTIQTIELALLDAAAANVKIEPLFVHFAGEKPESLTDYAKYATINQSVLNHGVFASPRKLPLLRDLLETAYNFSTAEYLIFTNIDIGLLPIFYRSVHGIVCSGCHSFSITRRTIQPSKDIQFFPTSLFAEVGEPHRGWDCFIFPRQFVPKMKLRNLCLGAPLAGLGVISNLIALDANFREFRNFHLTFHIGNDRVWNQAVNREYAIHNQSELKFCLRELEAEYGQFPRNTPPQNYLKIHRFQIVGKIYDWLLMKFHIPARYFRN